MAARAPKRANPLLTAGLVAAGVLGAVALASRRQGLFGRLTDGTAPFGAVAGRAALGALAGIVIAFGIVMLLRATNPRHRLIEDSPARPRWRQVLLWSVPVVLLLAVLGAAAGSATTPLQQRSQASDEGARYVDENGDGKPDLNADGTPKLIYDSDGDGRYDTQLVACPDGSTAYNGPVRGVHSSSVVPKIQIPIDDGCDGTVDRWVTLDRRPMRGPAPEREGVGGAGGSGGASLPSRSPDLGGVMRTVLILIAIAAAIGAIYAIVALILRRTPNDGGDEDLVPAPAGDETGLVDRQAAVLTLDDSIAAMLDGPDPRASVLAAYATLLDGLAAAGLPRQAYEAPAEHLSRRCLHTLHVRPEPLHELVDIFAMARFSEHPVTEAHRAEALAALRTAQVDLAGTLAGSGVV